IQLQENGPEDMVRLGIVARVGDRTPQFRSRGVEVALLAKDQSQRATGERVIRFRSNRRAKLCFGGVEVALEPEHEAEAVRVLGVSGRQSESGLQLLDGRRKVLTFREKLTQGEMERCLVRLQLRGGVQLVHRLVQ